MPPWLAVVIPPRVAVELLVVLDERLTHHFLASPLAMSIVEYPHLRDVDLDSLVENFQLVEAVHKPQGFVDGLDVQSKVVVLEDGTRVEPFHNTGLAESWAADVAALGNQAEDTRGEGVLERIQRDYGMIGDIIAATIRLLGSRVVRGVAVNTAGASRRAGAFEQLASRVRCFWKVARATDANTTHGGKGC